MAADEGICIVLSKGHRELDAILQEKPPIKENVLALLTRLQMSDKRTITRLIQIVKLDKSNEHFKCCQNTKRFHWWSKDDVFNGNIEKIWGPEVTVLAKFVDQKVKSTIVEECSLGQITGLMVAQDAVVKALEINISDLEVIYNDFIEHCFPSFFMTIDSFKEYMSKYGYQSKDTRLLRMFNSFTVEEKQFLTFQELFLGLAAMEPKCPQTEFRYGLIFRYYDLDADQNLSDDEIRHLMNDLSDGKGSNSKAEDVIKSLSSDNRLTFEQFVKAMTTKEFVGANNLCRSPKAILSEITKKKAHTSSDSDKKTKMLVRPERKNKGICYGCRAKKYEYGVHSVKLDTSGRCVEPRSIFERMISQV